MDTALGGLRLQSSQLHAQFGELVIQRGEIAGDGFERRDTRFLSGQIAAQHFDPCILFSELRHELRLT